MLRLFRKAQQDYIAAMLKDPTTKAAWAEKDGVYLLVIAEGSAAYFIPKPFLYILLKEEKKAPGLSFLLDEPAGEEPARLVSTDPQGRVKLQSEHHTVYAYEKNLKPFLAAKGATLYVTSPIKPIRVYAEGNPFCLGVVMPINPAKVARGV